MLYVINPETSPNSVDFYNVGSKEWIVVSTSIVNCYDKSLQKFVQHIYERTYVEDKTIMHHFNCCRNKTGEVISLGDRYCTDNGHLNTE